MALTKMYGLYSAIVLDVNDPEERGRIKLTTPLLRAIEFWAEPLMGVLNSDYGSETFPKVGDQVYVMFVDGSERHPVWFGGRRCDSQGSSETLSNIDNKEGSHAAHYTEEHVSVDQNSTEEIGQTKEIICGESCEVKGSDIPLIREQNGVVIARAICPLTGTPLFLVFGETGVAKKLKAE